MKEQDLISLGFNRTDVSKEESGDEAFYYYDLDFGIARGISLISPANTDVIDNKWYVEVFEDPSIRYDKYQDLLDFVTIIRKGINK